MFQIKNFVSIAAAVINHMRGTQTKVTDFTVGSVARTLIEAPAIEMDELYQQLFNGLQEAIPVATFNSFNFARLDAQSAGGVVLVTIVSSPTDTLIPANTVFSSPSASTTYVSAADTTIAAGDTVGSILVAAVAKGSAGNLPAGVSFTAAPTIFGFVSATNPVALSGGRDVETNDEQQRRFNDFIAALARATVEAIEYGAKTAKIYNVNGVLLESVKAAKVVEPYKTDNTQPIGLVEVYIHNGVGSTSGALVTETTKVLAGYTDPIGTKVPGWQAAGVHVVVYAAEEVPLNMAAVLTALAGYDAADLRSQATSALSSYTQALDVGEDWQFAEAIKRVKEIDGVGNFVFSAPVADVSPDSEEKIVSGTIAVT